MTWRKKNLSLLGLIVIVLFSLNCAGNLTFNRYQKTVELMRVLGESKGGNAVIAHNENGGEIVVLERNWQSEHFTIHYTLTDSSHTIPFNKREDINNNQVPDIIEEIAEVLECGYAKLNSSGLEEILESKKLPVNVYNFHDQQGRTASAVRDEIGLIDGLNKENISLVLSKYHLDEELKRTLFHELVHIFQVHYAGSHLKYSERTAILISEMLVEDYYPSEATMKFIIRLWEGGLK